MDPTTLADLLAALHLVQVIFVVGGEVLILAGGLLRWRWVRNLWFRAIHLLVIVGIGVEAVCRVPCPLTVWEHRLRTEGGGGSDPRSFMGRLVHDLLYVDVDPGILRVVHIAFAVLVVLTLIFVPPRLKKGLA